MIVGIQFPGSTQIVCRRDTNHATTQFEELAEAMNVLAECVLLEIP